MGDRFNNVFIASTQAVRGADTTRPDGFAIEVAL